MVYDANEYVAEKRRALEAWSVLLQMIVQDDDTGAVRSAVSRRKGRSKLGGEDMVGRTPPRSPLAVRQATTVARDA